MKPTVILPEKIQRTIEVDIDPKQWIWVPGTRKFVSFQEHYHGLQWQPALEQVLKETPFAVTPLYVFSPHYANVCASVSKKKNRPTLYDGNKEPLSPQARDDLYEQRTKDSWIWLDAYVKQQGKNLALATDHRLVNGVVQPQREERLRKCVQGNSVLVDLAFNAQGLPMRKSKEQEYRRGENIHYWSPVKDRVVTFGADADRDGLFCDWDPRYSFAAIRVLLCAEGAAKK